MSNKWDLNPNSSTNFRTVGTSNWWDSNPSSSTNCRTTRTPNYWDVELLGRRTTGNPSSSTSQKFDVPTVRRPSSSTICRTTGIRVPSVRHLSNCWDVELLGRRTTGIPISSTSQQFDKFELLGRRTGGTSNYCATPTRRYVEIKESGQSIEPGNSHLKDFCSVIHWVCDESLFSVH